MSAEYVVGQRWISYGEPQLGLGIIAELSGRLVTVSFPAVSDRRIYSADQAPISRVEYQAGDEIVTNDDQRLIVSDLYRNQGLIIYNCRDVNGQQQIVPELEISCFVTMTSPSQRLFNLQTDSTNSYKLRVATLEFLNLLQGSPANGLIGSRTSLLPHQLFITHEVSKRFAPRVMLADEVGLGKTIEAGMIVHQQLHAGYISRVLIVVPPSLIHQWLVEMLRRFNLKFSIFDSGRIDSINTANEDQILAIGDVEQINESTAINDKTINPFETEQFVLCPIDLLTSNSSCLEDIKSAAFDLLIVDEAHHLKWTNEMVSPEFECISQLCRICPGTLLLTATPESIGIESYFAQLSLLDPQRFHDLENFKTEQQYYIHLGNLISELLALKRRLSRPDEWAELESHTHDALIELLPSSTARLNQLNEKRILQLIDYLIDIHGTSRILFRNTRSSVGGFQQRKLNHYPFEVPQQYALLAGRNMLYPENQINDTSWLEFDPRVQWVITFLSQIRPAKVLLICALAQSARQLEHYLQLKMGISSAAFHEGMSVLERDRAAAYFADEIQGAQILICSEIGSEGRNFQFANHLILFDLPVNPDLLEQRIGRLDRIGQSGTIQIHVPYLMGTAQELVFLWYQQGLNQFTQTFSCAQRIFNEVRSELYNLIDGWPGNKNKVKKFITHTQQNAALVRQQAVLGKRQTA